MRLAGRLLALTLTGTAIVAVPAGPAGAEPQIVDRIRIVAHRGASVKYPEHSIPAYTRAVADGADFIEIDLVPTRDGVLIARHENDLTATTDIATHPEFRTRWAEKLIDGKRKGGWFAEDFTLAEIRTLRLRERWPELRGTAEDGKHAILTFAEIVTLAEAQARQAGRPIGLAPEIKHSTYFRSIGLPTEDRLLEALNAHAYTRSAPIIIQSFEVENLKYLRGKIRRPSNIQLLQLIGKPGVVPPDQRAKGSRLSYGDLLTPAGLKAVAAYADGVDPGKAAIIPRAASGGGLGQPTAVIRDAHANGLVVIPGVFRPENRNLPDAYRSDAPIVAVNRAGAIAEIRAYLAVGIDMVFTDDPATAAEAVAAHVAERKR